MVNAGSLWKMLFFVIILVFSKAGHINGSYHIKNNTGLWQDARINCSMATPELVATSAGVSLRHPADLVTVLDNNGDEAWIGYFKLYTRFQYLGCVSRALLTQLTVTTNENIINSKTIGDCYMACRYNTVIGVSVYLDKMLNCSCIHNLNHLQHYLTNGTCIQKCLEGGSDDKFVCGSSDGTSISLYKVLGDSTKQDNSSLCMYYTRQSTTKPNWRVCSGKRRFLCEHANGTIADVTANESSWIASQRECSLNNKYPATEEAAERDSTPSNHYYWIGVVRSEVIFNLKNINDSTEVSVRRKHCYLNLKDNEIKVECDVDIDATRKAVCQTNTYSNIETDKGTSKGGAIAGGVVVVIIFILIILILLFLRHRGMYPFQDTKSTSQQSTRKPHISPGQANPSNECIEDGEGPTEEISTNHNNFNLDKDVVGSNNDRSKSSTAPSTPVHHILETEEQQYIYVDTDTPVNEHDLNNINTGNNKANGNAQRTPLKKTGNAYNKLVTGEETIYNVTDQMPRERSDTINDDYNTTSELDNRTRKQWQTDNVYNHLGSESQTVVDESEYNATGWNIGKVGNVNQHVTDNMYNTLQTDIDDYDHIQHGGAVSSYKFPLK